MAITDKSVVSLTLRPGTFEDIIGLQDVVRGLKAKLDKNEIPRALLIRGPYGCGKTTLAHIIAKYIQTVANPFFDGQPDVEEVNGANYRKIDDMRVLAERAGTYPMLGTYKVIIMDECQQLTKDAQQILLKELEVKVSPTVWILCTTDPEKINQGVRDRCFPVIVEGMSKTSRHELLCRAAVAVGRTAPFADLEAAIDKAEIVSPRRILMAFEAYNAGADAKAAAATMHHERVPEMFDIAMGVVYGMWDNGYTMYGKKLPSLSEQLKDFDDKLKKKQKKVGDEPSAAFNDEDGVEDDELLDAGSRDVASHTLRLILTTLLKNQVIKGGTKALKAAQALLVLAQCTGADTDGMKWALTVAGMYRAHLTLNAK